MLRPSGELSPCTIGAGDLKPPKQPPHVPPKGLQAATCGAERADPFLSPPRPSTNMHTHTSSILYHDMSPNVFTLLQKSTPSANAMAASQQLVENSIYTRSTVVKP